LALELLRLAFDLKFRIADGVPDALLDRAGGFVAAPLILSVVLVMTILLRW